MMEPKRFVRFGESHPVISALKVGHLYCGDNSLRQAQLAVLLCEAGAMGGGQGLLKSAVRVRIIRGWKRQRVRDGVRLFLTYLSIPFTSLTWLLQGALQSSPWLLE